MTIPMSPKAITRNTKGLNTTAVNNFSKSVTICAPKLNQLKEAKETEVPLMNPRINRIKKIGRKKIK